MRKLFSLLIAFLACIGTMYAWDYKNVQIDDLYYNLDTVNKTAEITYQYFDTIGNYPGLTTADIPSSVTYAAATFSVTSIGEGAFYACRSMTSVIIPSSVKSIGKQTFYDCRSLTSLSIPNSVTYIGDFAFCGCTGLISLSISDSVTSIEDGTFHSCSGLTSVTIPGSVTSIGSSAFASCYGLTSVSIPNSVTSIGSSAFSGCGGLTSVTIPNSVTSIGSSAFSGCGGLTSVTIPNSVTSIGSSAFASCRSLSSIDVSTANLNYCSVDGVLFSKDHTILIQYPGGKQGAYIIPESVTSIGSSAFAYCTGLTSVTIPNSVVSIGDNAFNSCSSLTSIDIPNSVTHIGNYAFYNCNIASLTIPGNVTSIGQYTFAYTKLVSVTIPNGVASIGDGAFYDCHNLASVTIPNSVTNIGNMAFHNSGLTSVTIPNSVTSIGTEAFVSCRNMTSITIGNRVTRIENWAFAYCTGLTSITCTAVNPPTISSYVFYGVDKSVPLYVPTDSFESYKAANGWKDFTNIQPKDIFPVIFLNYNGEVLSEQNVVYGMAAEAPEVPAREGYTFSGWTADIEHIVAPTYAIALYDKIGGTVTYLSEDGDVIATENVNLHLPAAPIIAGKSFKGWFTESADPKNGIVFRATYTSDNPTAHDDVTVTPTSNSAEVTFPYITGALTYELIIRDQSGTIVCKMMFNGDGQLLGIAFALSRNRTQQQATQSIGFNFTVTGLNANTTYEYAFVAYDETDEVIETLSGSFTTTNESSTEDNEQVNSPSAVRKYLEDGHLMINANAHIFDTQGKMIK